MVPNDIECWGGVALRERDTPWTALHGIATAMNVALGTSRFKLVDDNDLGLDNCGGNIPALVADLNAWLFCPATTTATTVTITTVTTVTTPKSTTATTTTTATTCLDTTEECFSGTPKKNGYVFGESSSSRYICEQMCTSGGLSSSGRQESRMDNVGYIWYRDNGDLEDHSDDDEPYVSYLHCVKVHRRCNALTTTTSSTLTLPSSIPPTSTTTTSTTTTTTSTTTGSALPTTTAATASIATSSSTAVTETTRTTKVNGNPIGTGTAQTGNDGNDDNGNGGNSSDLGDSGEDGDVADSKGDGKGIADAGINSNGGDGINTNNDGYGGSVYSGATRATVPSNVATTSPPLLGSVVVNVPKKKRAVGVVLGVVLGGVVVIAALVFVGVRCRREMQYKRIDRLGLRSTTAMENIAYEHTSPGVSVTTATGNRHSVTLTPNAMYSSSSNDPTDGDNAYDTAVPGIKSTTLRSKGNPKGRSQQPTYATIQHGQYAAVQQANSGGSGVQYATYASKTGDVQYATYAGGGGASRAGKGGGANEQYAGWEQNAMYSGADDASPGAGNSTSNEQYVGWEQNAMYAGADDASAGAGNTIGNSYDESGGFELVAGAGTGTARCASVGAGNNTPKIVQVYGDAQNSDDDDDDADNHTGSHRLTLGGTVADARAQTCTASGPRLRSNSMWSVGNIQRDRSGTLHVEAQQHGVAYAVPFAAVRGRGAAHYSDADGSAMTYEESVANSEA